MASPHRQVSNPSKVEFPAFQDHFRLPSDENGSPIEPPRSGDEPFTFPKRQSAMPKDRLWQPRSKGRVSFALPDGFETRERQKSLSEAWRTVRHRHGSVTDSVTEIGKALKAPVSPSLVLLCGGWYMCSILSNASSKSILTAFRFPITLTVVQFFFVSTWCIIASLIAQRFTRIRTIIPALRHPIRPPSRELIMITLPLTAFQVGGHILNSDAMSRIPVSLVHTIKGLSPLFTVLAYRLFFRIHYSIWTYLALIPLTLGVIMACSANVSGDLLGLLYAFGSAMLFVTQNIVSKRLFNESARAEAEGYTPLSGAPLKPDKLNLLCYSSGLAFLFTFPIWVWFDGIVLVKDLIYQGTVPLAQRPDALDHGRLTLEFIFNGTFHFIQSLVAFILLSMTSPVTYSVASLIKRVFVITFAIVWFGNPVTRVQASGILLTFVGLYLYDRTHDAGRAEKRARLLQTRDEAPLLPLADGAPKMNGNALYPMPTIDVEKRRRSPLRYDPNDSKRRTSNEKNGVVRESNDADALLPGTRQEATWSMADGSSRRDGIPV